VTEPTTIAVVHPGPEAGTVSATVKAWFAGMTHSGRRTLKYGRRSTVEGTVTDLAGAPLRGVTLSATERTTGAGGRVTRRDQVDSAGRCSERQGRGVRRS
jgi:hypothetical protein